MFILNIKKLNFVVLIGLIWGSTIAFAIEDIERFNEVADARNRALEKAHVLKSELFIPGSNLQIILDNGIQNQLNQVDIGLWEARRLLMQPQNEVVPQQADRITKTLTELELAISAANEILDAPLWFLFHNIEQTYIKELRRASALISAPTVLEPNLRIILDNVVRNRLKQADIGLLKARGLLMQGICEGENNLASTQNLTQILEQACTFLDQVHTILDSPYLFLFQNAETAFKAAFKRINKLIAKKILLPFELVDMRIRLSNAFEEAKRALEKKQEDRLHKALSQVYALGVQENAILNQFQTQLVLEHLEGIINNAERAFLTALEKFDTLIATVSLLPLELRAVLMRDIPYQLHPAEVWLKEAREALAQVQAGFPAGQWERFHDALAQVDIFQRATDELLTRFPEAPQDIEPMIPEDIIDFNNQIENVYTPLVNEALLVDERRDEEDHFHKLNNSGQLLFDGWIML